MLDTPCSFAKTTDDEERCIPIGQAAIFYSDMSCATAVGWTGKIGCAPPQFAVENTTAQECAGAVSIYKIRQVIAPIADPPLVWYIKADGTCVTLGGLKSGFFSVGPVMKPTDFVGSFISP